MRSTMPQGMDFQVSVDISAPTQTVWSVMSDAEHWHEWTESVTSIRLLDKGPMAVGTRALVKQPKFPPAVWKVTELRPGSSFTWKTGAPGLWAYGRHSVEPIAGGTRATLHLHYEGVLGNLLAGLTRGITNRYIGYEAAGLKRRSETIARS